MLQTTWEYRCLFHIVILFLLDIYPEVGLLDHIVVLFLISWGTSILLCIVVQFTFPPRVHKGALFSTSLPIFFICGLLDNSHSDSCEVIPTWGFDLHFPHNYWCWASFHVSSGHLYVFLGEMSIQILCTVFNQIFLKMLSCMHSLYWYSLAINLLLDI